MPGVPYTNPKALWSLSADNFNSWRRENDLPLLLAFFKGELPAFQDWMMEFDISDDDFIVAEHTGDWFIGSSQREFVRYSWDGKNRFDISDNFNEKFKFLSKHHRIEKLAPEKRFKPYLVWGRTKFGKKKFIPVDKANNGFSETIEFNFWTTDLSTNISRASINKGFEVLKLGQVDIPDKSDISQRNLDFCDLDEIVIGGTWHGSHATSISFSSCEKMKIQETNLHHWTLISCVVDEMKVLKSGMQDFIFIACSVNGMELRESRVNGLTLDRCQVAGPSIDRTEIDRFEYVAKDVGHRYLAQADTVRRFRAAFQSIGRQGEASRFYYEERCYERKALWTPYLANRKYFPKMAYAGTIRTLFEAWRDGHRSTRESLKNLLDISIFLLRVWLTPRYAARALRFKLRYIASLLDYLIWGYGERPARVIGAALAVVMAFAGGYYVSGPTKGNAWESWYQSLFTFTTLGYGDASRIDGLCKALWSAEVFIGIVFLGLFVGALSNKSRY